MNNKAIITVINEGILKIELNRPKAANALSITMLKELQEAFEIAKYEQSIRCIVITGSGGKVFCAGADLKERSEMDAISVKKTVSLIRETINKLETFPQPVIAAINGAAFGGGLELALACDIRVASRTAKLGLTETSLGIIPGAGGTQRLPQLIGKGKAKELIFTARKIDAEEALQIGLVEYVEEPENVGSKAIEIAREIAQNAPIAITQAKTAINEGYHVNLTTGLSIERAAYEMTIPTKDRLEGLKAFKEKRKPHYIGE